MEDTSSNDDEKKPEEHVNAVTSFVTSPRLTPAQKKTKTETERQRECRIRQIKRKEALNINGDMPAKKSRADQEEHSQKLNAKLNSGSTEMSPRQEGLSGSLPPVTAAQLTPSGPDAKPIILQNEAVIKITANRETKTREQLENVSKVRKSKRVQQYPTGELNIVEICQLPSQPILTPHLPNDETQLISNQKVNTVTSFVTSPPVTPAQKKSKTQAERQREYRLRQKKLKEAQKYINGIKPAKKTRADYQREYRLRQKLKFTYPLSLLSIQWNAT